MINQPACPSSKDTLPSSLRIFLSVFLLYTAITWISCFVHYRLGHSQAYSSPFIHQSWDRFTDYRTYYTRFAIYFHKPEFFKQYAHRDFAYFSYPAPAAVVYWCFYHLWHYIAAFVGLAIAWSVGLAYGLFRVLERRGASPRTAAGISFIMLALAFPVDFMIERGNIELVVWIAVFIGLYLYLRGRNGAAAVLLGIAASIKLFPVIFCGILLQRRRYGAVFLALLTAAVVTFLSLWFAGPTISIAFHGFNHTVVNYQQSYSIPARASDGGMDHSFFALTKIIGRQLGLDYLSWLHPYYVIAGLISLALFFGRVLRMPVANQLLFIAVMAVGLPPNSFDYTLVYLYAPWTAMCVVAFEAHRRGVIVPGLTALFLCFIPLLAPFSLFVRHDVRFGGQIQSMMLLVLLGLDLIYVIPDDMWLSKDRFWRATPHYSEVEYPIFEKAANAGHFGGHSD